MEKINSVDMVRKIRDSQFEQMKDLSKNEFLEYIRENGGKALAQLKELAQKHHIPA